MLIDDQSVRFNLFGDEYECVGNGVYVLHMHLRVVWVRRIFSASP